MSIKNYDLRSKDGGTIYHLPEKEGAAGQGNLEPPNVYEESPIALYPIGTKFVDGERTFHYAYSGEALPTTLRGVTGYVARTRDTVDTYDTAEPIGQTYLRIDGVSATDPTVNLYAGSYLMIKVTANYRVTMRVTANTVPEGSSPFTTTLTLDRPLPIEIPANTDLDIFPSRYADIRKVIDGTYAGDMYPILGVHLIPITANYYFWMQTWGPCFITCYNVEMGDDPYNRTAVFQNDGSIRGCGEVWGASTPTGHQFAGYTLATNGAGSEWIMLMLDR